MSTETTEAIVVQTSPVATPMTMLQMAVSRGATMDELKMLLDLRKELEADEARKAFNKAFSAFKSESVQIIKNITVTDGPLKGKKYANLFAAVDAITPALSKHGLSHSWKLTKDEPTWIEVTCTLRHELGHCETVSMGGPPDTGGAKNAIQARASSKSYLERYTLLAITGLASSEQDNDGNSTGAQMDPDALQNYLDGIMGANNQDQLKDVYMAGLKVAESAGDNAAKTKLAECKNTRYRQLSKGAR